MKTRLMIMAACMAVAMSAMAALPSVTLKNLDGKTVDTAQISNDGKPIVISFWATWCKPCVRELKAISEVYDDWQEEFGVKVIAVSIDEAQKEEMVKPLVEGKGWEFEVLLDPNSEFKRQMGVTNPPHAFIVDGQGNVVWNHQGYVDGGEEDIYEVLKSLSE